VRACTLLLCGGGSSNPPHQYNTASMVPHHMNPLGKRIVQVACSLSLRFFVFKTKAKTKPKIPNAVQSVGQVC
jgi:hypothetical protein